MKPLAFNLKDAKKVAGDKDSSTFQLKDGHSVRIAHAPLPAIQRKQLERLPIHLDDGGSPSGSDDRAPASVDPQTDDQADLRSQQNVADVDPGAQAGAAADEVNALPQDASTVPPYLQPNSADQSQQANAPQPLPQASDAQGTPVVNPNVAKPQPAAQSPIDLNASYGQGQKAIKEQADVDSDLAQKNAQNEQEHIQALNDLAQGQKQNFSDFKTLQDKAIQNYMNGKIDPKSYVENMSSNQKVNTAIGLFLGGFSTPFTHQGNPALEFLNKQIDRDIQAQQSRKDQEKTLLGENQALYHDQLLGMNATRITLNDIAAHKVALAAAQDGSPAAQARKDALLSDLAFKSNQLLQQNAARATILHQNQESQATGQPSSLDPAKLVTSSGAPPDAQKEILKEIGNAQAVTASKASLLANWDQAAKDVRLLSGGHPLYSTVVTPPSIKALGPLEDSTIHDNEGRVNEFEKKDLIQNHPQPFDDDSTIAIKRKAYEDFLNKKVTSAPYSSAYGINLQNYKSTNPFAAVQAQPQFKVGDVLYVKGQPVQIIDSHGNYKPVSK